MGFRPFGLDSYIKSLAVNKVKPVSSDLPM